MSDDVVFRDPKLTINRVYTRGGDAGRTRLVGGQAVDKDDLRIECYGTVDELNAVVGGARLACVELGLGALGGWLLRVQHGLFNLGNTLAALPEDMREGMPRVRATDVTWLEERIDAATAELPTLRSFVLAGANRADVELHLARTICRRAERLCVALARREGNVPSETLAYLNRLSDAFFVWGRVAARAGGSDEVLWDPNAG
jgi:cob(I)alamin adenosyltransferase